MLDPVGGEGESPADGRRLAGCEEYPLSGIHGPVRRAWKGASSAAGVRGDFEMAGQFEVGFETGDECDGAGDEKDYAARGDVALAVLRRGGCVCPPIDRLNRFCLRSKFLLLLSRFRLPVAIIYQGSLISWTLTYLSLRRGQGFCPILQSHP